MQHNGWAISVANFSCQNSWSEACVTGTGKWYACSQALAPFLTVMLQRYERHPASAAAVREGKSVDCAHRCLSGAE